MTAPDDARSTTDEWAVPDLPEPPEWEPPDGVSPEELARDADEAWFDDATKLWRRLKDRMGRHDARVQRMLDKLHADTAAEEARIVEWGAKKGRRVREGLAFLEEALGRHALEVREKTGGKVKSLTSPYAVVETELKGGKSTASQETLEWARTACPDAVKVEEKLLVSVLLRAPGVRVVDGQAVTASGEVIPGIVVEPKHVEATVRVVEGEA